MPDVLICPDTLRSPQMRHEVALSAAELAGIRRRLEVHEAPLLGRAPDTLVALEPGCSEPELGGCRLEDLVLVTHDGFQALTDFPYDLEQ